MFNERQQTSEVRERILTTARDLFIKNGFKGTSIRDIASASGTNVAMVNYYFHSKYNLFEIIFEDAFNRFQKRVFSILSSDLPFFELIETVVNSYYETMTEYPQIPVFILNEVNQNPERLSERIRTNEPHNVFRIMSERIKAEEEKGLIKETSPIDFLLNLLSLCVFPFVFKNLGLSVAGVSQDEYTAMIQNHKKYVIEFIINALKK